MYLQEKLDELHTARHFSLLSYVLDRQQGSTWERNHLMYTYEEAAKPQIITIHSPYSKQEQYFKTF